MVNRASIKHKGGFVEKRTRLVVKQSKLMARIEKDIWGKWKMGFRDP